jgi:hypothetical protein
MNYRRYTDEDLDRALSLAIEFQGYWNQAAKQWAAEGLHASPFLRQHLNELDRRVRRLTAEFHRRQRARKAGVAC